MVDGNGRHRMGMVGWSRHRTRMVGWSSDPVEFQVQDILVRVHLYFEKEALMKSKE